MRVVVASPDDIPAWLVLAGEVEPLFGPMLNDPGFHQALRRNVERGSAYCVREADGPPGAPLMGGVLCSAKPPQPRIGWLAVAAAWRRRGVGRLLVEQVLASIVPPAEASVVTFGEDVVDGKPARSFYESLGFRAAEPAPAGPDGGSRQVFRLAPQDFRLAPKEAGR